MPKFDGCRQLHKNGNVNLIQLRSRLIKRNGRFYFIVKFVAKILHNLVKFDPYLVCFGWHLQNPSKFPRLYQAEPRNLQI
ncbi:hypothetical protein H740_03781 [Campylobacter showae CC57C]|uniref:Uncharacterized protein n=1 Tax=Campylobacter showae CC57C TaxID=1073353 RepID=M3JE41_9BACT|nr:hypothetical protein H740_03781 [Campylobacter showae CC57C]